MPVGTSRERIGLLVMIVENLDAPDRESLLNSIAPVLREVVELQLGLLDGTTAPPADALDGHVYDVLASQPVAVG